MLEVEIGGLDKQEERQWNHFLQHSNDQFEVGSARLKLLGHSSADLEEDIGDVARPVVRLRRHVELQRPLERDHRRLGGVDGVLDRLARPLGRLAKRFAVIQTLTDDDHIQRFTDVTVRPSQIDLVYYAGNMEPHKRNYHLDTSNTLKSNYLLLS